MSDKVDVVVLFTHDVCISKEIFVFARWLASVVPQNGKWPVGKLYLIFNIIFDFDIRNVFHNESRQRFW